MISLTCPKCRNQFPSSESLRVHLKTCDYGTRSSLYYDATRSSSVATPDPDPSPSIVEVVVETIVDTFSSSSDSGGGDFGGGGASGSWD